MSMTQRSNGTPAGAVTTASCIEHYLTEVRRISSSLDRRAIEEIVELLFDAWQRRKTVYAMGNGGSASTSSHFVCDLAKVTIVPGRPRFRVLGLTDNVPLTSAWTNDSGFGAVFAEQLEPWLEEGDVVVGFSVHGGSGEGDSGPWSQNLVRAVGLARERGARVIGFSGFDGGALARLADVCVTIPVSAEPEGTALVESLHVTLHHLVCVALRERIGAAPGGPGEGGDAAV
jgi:D-sedoheptulose 7-phosphate isomerase